MSHKKRMALVLKTFTVVCVLVAIALIVISVNGNVEATLPNVIEFKFPNLSQLAVEEANNVVSSQQVEVGEYYNVPISEELQDFTREVSNYYGLNHETMFKMMYTESRFNPNSVSSTNDHGILQINANWYSSYISVGDQYDKYVESTGADLYDVKTNVIISARELSYWKSVCTSRGYMDESDYLDCYNKGFSYFQTGNKSYSSRVYNDYDLQRV